MSNQVIKRHLDNPDRMQSLSRCIPSLFSCKRKVLYVGANTARVGYGSQFLSAKCKMTILEAWKDNVRFLQKKGFDVILGDVRECHHLFSPEDFDVTFWWHGPEHIEKGELQIALAAIEEITKEVVVLGCPWGVSPQDAWRGNPYEIHVSSLEPEIFNAFGYSTETLGAKGPRSNITCWKHLSSGIERTKHIEVASILTRHIPWVTFKAKTWLEDYLKSSMRVFEYGSGGSTLFFAKRVKHLNSVEHNTAWHKSVIREITRNRLVNVDSFLIVPKEFKAEIPAYGAKSYSTKVQSLAHLNFEEYVKTIDNFPDDNFDLAFIDGRSRASCVPHVIRKIHRGGFVVLDNSRRKHYGEAVKMLGGFERTDFLGYGPCGENPWQTSIWRMP